MIGKLLERLFVEVRADLSQMSGELQQGVATTKAATQMMAKQWETVSGSIENLTTDLQKGVITQGQYMSQLNKHASLISKVGGTYREAQKQVHGYAASLRQAAVAAQPAFNTVPVRNFGRSVGQARMQMLNLGYQINDVGMTLATGMNPLTVLIQQGSQILQIYAGQGGVRAALSDIGRILVGLGTKLWPIAVIAGGFGLMTREINKTTDVTVGFGDTIKAVFQTLYSYIQGPVTKSLDFLRSIWNTTLDFIVNLVKDRGNRMVRIILISIELWKAAIKDVPGVFKGAFFTAGAYVMEALYKMGAQIEKFMGGVASVMNDTFGTSFDTNPVYDWVSSLEVARHTLQGMADDVGQNSKAWAEFQAKASEIMSTDYMGKFFDDVKSQAIKNAMQQAADGAKELGSSARGAMEDVKELIEELEEGLSTAADNLSQVFGNAFERLADTGRLTFRDFIKDLNQLIIRSTSELLQQQLSTMFQNLATSRGGLGSVFANVFTSLFGGGLPGRARGGVEMPWRNFVAGEEGPKIVSQDGPAGARRVKTAGATRAEMARGGGNVTINQYISTPNVESFKQSQSQIASRAQMFLTRGRRNQ